MPNFVNRFFPFIISGTISILSLHLTGCNVFNFMDSPSGDDAILEEARDCFDQGDYNCASKYYSMLSSSPQSDIANTESAFEIMAQNGPDLSSFMRAAVLGSSGGGDIITNLAGSITPLAGQTARLNIFHAFQKQSLIQNSHLKGLVQFVTSLALLAELLAENAAVQGNFQSTDLVLKPINCYNFLNTITSAKYPGSIGSCNAPARGPVVSGSSFISLLTATDASLSGAPTLYMINAAIGEMASGLGQLSASSTLSSATLSFISSMSTDISLTIQANTQNSPAYRGLLLLALFGTQLSSGGY